jgi:hypothetical protein
MAFIDFISSSRQLFDSGKASAIGLATGRSGQDLLLNVVQAGRTVMRKRLAPGSYLVSPDPEADIVVLGLPAGAGFRIEMAEGDPTISLAPMGEGIMIDGVATALGKVVAQAHELTASIGTYSFQMRSPRAFGSFASSVTGSANEIRSVRGLTAAGASASGLPPRVLVLGAISLAAALLAMALPSSLNFAGLNWGGSGQTQGNAPTPWANVTEGVTKARSLLSGMDLSERVKVSDTGGKLRFTGEVGGNEARRWQDALAMIRTRSSVAIDNGVRLDPAESGAGRSISGIALAPEAYVLARTGQRVSVGGVLPDGWTVREITSSKVVIERDGFVEALTF